MTDIGFFICWTISVVLLLLVCYSSYISTKWKKIDVENIKRLRIFLELHFKKCDNRMGCNDAAKAGIDRIYEEDIKESIKKTKDICGLA